MFYFINSLWILCPKFLLSQHLPHIPFHHYHLAPLPLLVPIGRIRIPLFCQCLLKGNLQFPSQRYLRLLHFLKSSFRSSIRFQFFPMLRRKFLAISSLTVRFKYLSCPGIDYDLFPQCRNLIQPFFSSLCLLQQLLPFSRSSIHFRRKIFKVLNPMIRKPIQRLCHLLQIEFLCPVGVASALARL